MADTLLDVFKSDAFSVVSLTDALNKIPFLPGRAGQVIPWGEAGVMTTTIMIEEVAGSLVLLSPTPRGGPGQTTAKPKRTARALVVPHYQVDDSVQADEILGVRAFGQASMTQTLQELVSAKLQQHVQLEMDPTLEYQRVGALKGIILNGDGSTLYNLFTEFAVTQPTEVAFDLTAASPASGVVRRTCTGVVRTIAEALGGLPFGRIYGFTSDSFWDDLIAHKEVRETFLSQTEASQLRGNAAYQTLDYGGITFENYRGKVGTTPFIADDKCNFFAVGVPGLFRTVYAPSDYVAETASPIGLPRYAKQYPHPNGKAICIEAQMNALSYCTRPGTLVQGKRGA